MSRSESRSSIVLELAEEFLERCRQGRRPTLKEYVDRHPDLADEIREVFPAMAMMERIALAEESIALGPTGANTSTPAAPPPQQFGDFRILRELGRGGMGVVYEAEQISLGRHVALKVLPPHMTHDAKHLRRFAREARAAGKLHHTNIVPVFGIGEHDGKPYYVMQFIHGQGLDEVLGELKRMQVRGECSASTLAVEGHQASRRDASAADIARSLLTGRFDPGPGGDGSDLTPLAAVETTIAPSTAGNRPTPAPSPSLPSPGSILVKNSNVDGEVSAVGKSTYWQGVARIGAQTADALEYAHKQRVLHRDIKPSNLLLDTRGTIWVADFGLAKADDQQDLTGTGDVLGTLRYMPPEALEGRADERSDQYSLGLTLYELIAFRPAFDEKDRGRLVRQVTAGATTPLRKLNAAVPLDLETIVHKAIAKEPARRYATVGELAEDLKRFLDDRPIRARPVGPLERAWRWCKRNPALAGATSLAASALIAVTLLSLLYADRAARHAVELKSTLAKSDRLLAIRNLDRGQAAFEEGQIGPGMLWMIESWRSAIEAGDPAWQRAARANLASWQPRLHRLRSVLSHAGPVDAAAFSPDGKTILTGGDDRAARLWDAATGELIGPSLPHPDVVSGAVFSPDGKTILTGCRDGAARLWDTATGRPIGQPLRHQDEVNAVAFSPDGKTILTGCRDKMARLWDAATGRPIGEPMPNEFDVVAVAFSRDGKTVVTGGRWTARLWEAGAGRPIGETSHRMGHIRAIGFSPDGKTLLTGSSDGGIHLWDAATGRLLRPPVLAHRGSVRAVAFSPDGKTILTGGGDKTARLWDAATGLPIGIPWRHQGPVVAVAFQSDGKALLTGSSDGTARLWDATPDPSAGQVSEHEGGVAAVAFSPDGKTILTGGGDRTARLWDAATGLPISPPLRHENRVSAVAFSADGKTVVTGGEDRTARLWDAGTGRSIGAPLTHKGHVTAVAFSPDGKTLLTESDSKEALMWDAATGRPIGLPIPQTDPADAVAFSPDGKSFVIGCPTGTARLWDVATRTPLGAPFPHPGCVSAVAFSPDGKTLLTGCEDGMARLWDVATRTLLVPPLPHEGWVFGVAFSPDGETVLTSGRGEKKVRLWNRATGIPLGPSFPHPDGVPCVAFSPDGKFILTGCADGKARLFRNSEELPDDLGRVATWTEVATGLTLDARQGTIQNLDNQGWRSRRELMRQQGGPPQSAESRPVALTADQVVARAVVKAQRYVDLEPDDGGCWLNLGLALALAGDRQAAGEALLKAEKLGAIPHLQLNNAAWVLATHSDPRLRDAGHAVALARLAVDLSPEEGTYWNTLGVAHYRADNHQEAVEALGRSMELRGGGDAFDWFFLAMAHWRLGDQKKARDWYDKARDWAGQNSPNDEELASFRDEATALLNLMPMDPR